jgi:hypothetical protein
MSLLQQNSPELDDAARGEDLTRGTSHILWAMIAAAVVVSAAIIAYALASRETPAAAGQIIRTTVHFVHRETTGLDAAGKPMPKDAFDQALVFTHLQLHNQSKNPLFLRQVLTNIVLDDGIHSSYAAMPHDYERLFQATPELASLHGTPISPDSTIPPGESLEGDIVAAFRLSHAQWDARKGLNYTVSLQYQPDLALLGAPSVNTQ